MNEEETANEKHVEYNHRQRRYVEEDHRRKIETGWIITEAKEKQTEVIRYISCMLRPLLAERKNATSFFLFFTFVILWSHTWRAYHRPRRRPTRTKRCCNDAARRWGRLRGEVAMMDAAAVRCVRVTCARRSARAANIRPHSLHWNGRVPRCLFMWSSNCWLVLAENSQWVHEWIVWPLCVFPCIRREYLKETIVSLLRSKETSTDLSGKSSSHLLQGKGWDCRACCLPMWYRRSDFLAMTDGQ